MEIDSEDLADVELRQIIGSVMSYNLECDKSLGELVDLFKDADMKTEFSMGLRAQGKNLAEVNAKYVAVDVTVKPDAPTLEELKEDYKVKYDQYVVLRAERYLFGKMKVGVVMVTLQGRLLGMNEVAREIGEAYHWRLPEQEREHE